jgi:hypothetical protein
MTIFTFPEDGRWNPETEAIEFSVAVGEYKGTVRVPNRVFRRLLAAPTLPEKCVEAYHLYRTEFERAAEAKLSRRELGEDGNLEVTGRDLRGSAAEQRELRRSSDVCSFERDYVGEFFAEIDADGSDGTARRFGAPHRQPSVLGSDKG